MWHHKLSAVAANSNINNVVIVNHIKEYREREKKKWMKKQKKNHVIEYKLYFLKWKKTSKKRLLFLLLTKTEKNNNNNRNNNDSLDNITIEMMIVLMKGSWIVFFCITGFCFFTERKNSLKPFECLVIQIWEISFIIHIWSCNIVHWNLMWKKRLFTFWKFFSTFFPVLLFFFFLSE